MSTSPAAFLLRTTSTTPADGAEPAARVRLSEVLAALSHALDLTEGQPLGHSVRACVIGMRLADELGLDLPTRSALYYSLLLKDAGCSSNAARMSALFGSDDREVKRRMKLVNWHDTVSLAWQTFRSSALGGTIRERMHYFLGITRTPHMTREIIQLRCERGADIALQLGFPADTGDAIRALDEHWNGRGHPAGLKGNAIPLLARIANLAQSMEIFHAGQGIAGAMLVARERRGTWFDPQLTDIVLSWAGDLEWWEALRSVDAAVTASRMDGDTLDRVVDERTIDDVARAFSEIIDAKSPFTYRHSSNVAQYAAAIAGQLGLAPAEEKRLRRAGLLHDIGKVGVSNTVLDKNGPLDPAERSAIEEHPRYTWEILSRIEAFRGFAWMASVHHEKLDGSGYPWRLAGDQLDLSARILVVADMYEALTADRPYRPGMRSADALRILEAQRGAKICPIVLDALQAYVKDLDEIADL
jgi:putative nucleotidyltransferase with HDIG domain